MRAVRLLSRISRTARSAPWAPASALLAATVALGTILLAPQAGVAETAHLVSVGAGPGGEPVERYGPASLAISAGDTVAWRWTAGQAHTVTAADDSWSRDGRRGETGAFTVTFTVPGTYTYYCSIHATAADARPDVAGRSMASGKMVGLVTVLDAVPGRTRARTAEDVQIIDFALSPDALLVRPGTRVRWENPGTAPHSLSSENGAFSSGALSRGDAFSFVFSRPGTFEYSCVLHPQIAGAVIVTESASPRGRGTTLAPGPSAAPPPSPPDSHVPIAVIRSGFSPDTLNVAPGTRVKWTNAGNEPHSVTATDGSFDSGLLSAGDTFAVTVDRPGVVAYSCSVHPSMTGRVTVTEGVTGRNQPAGRGGAYDRSNAWTPEATSTPTATNAAPGPSTKSTSATPAAASDDPTIVEVGQANGGSSPERQFNPATLNVTAGTIVRWRLFDPDGGGGHDIQAYDGSFSSGSRGGMKATGQTFDHVFELSGTYTYYCSRHAGAADADPARIEEAIANGKMVGKIAVSPNPNGTLALATHPVSFGIVALSGITQDIDATPPAWRASDTTGTGGGWTVTISGADFTSGSSAIPAARLKVRVLQGNIRIITGNNPPVTQVSAFQAMSAGVPLRILQAPAGGGTGTFEFLPDFRLTIPATTAAGVYIASMVVTINSGP